MSIPNEMPTYSLQSVASNRHTENSLAGGAKREGLAGGSTTRLATVREETTNENPVTVFKY